MGVRCSSITKYMIELSRSTYHGPNTPSSFIHAHTALTTKITHTRHIHIRDKEYFKNKEAFASGGKFITFKLNPQGLLLGQWTCCCCNFLEWPLGFRLLNAWRMGCLVMLSLECLSPGSIVWMENFTFQKLFHQSLFKICIGHLINVQIYLMLKCCNFVAMF